MDLKYSFPSRRSAVISSRGIVATSQPLAQVQLLLNIVDFGMDVQTALVAGSDPRKDGCAIGLW